MLGTEREQGTGERGQRSENGGRAAFRKGGALLLLALLALLVAGGCGEAPGPRRPAGAEDGVVAVDDTGREVRLPRPARRVVSLLPAGTETVFALGAGDRLVGRTRYDTEPHLAHLPSVGGGLDPSLEALVALRPDLVLAWEPPGGSRVRARLEELGIPVFALATRDTAAVFRNVRSLGRLLGRDSAARALEDRVHAGLDSVRASVPAGARPSVLYVVSLDPPIIAGTGNFLAELIEVAGGDPVAISDERPGVSPQVSLEEVLRLRPDVVILPVGGDSAATLDRLRSEPGWRDLDAVRQGRVAAVPADLMGRPGPGLGGIARRMREAIRAGSPP